MRSKISFYFYCGLFNQHSLLILSLIKNYSRRSLEVPRGLYVKEHKKNSCSEQQIMALRASWTMNAHNKNKLVWTQFLCAPCSAPWQFIMAFENAKGLDEKKVFPCCLYGHSQFRLNHQRHWAKASGDGPAPAMESVGVTSTPVTEELALPVTSRTRVQGQPHQPA